MTKSYFGLQFPKPKSLLQVDKSFTSVASRSSSLNRAGKNLKTPIRRFFKLELLRSKTRKRGRPDDHNTPHRQVLDPLEATPPPPSDPITSPTTVCGTPNKNQDFKDTPSPQQFPAAPCVTLQDSDSTIDAVVASTLLTLPCCHEDILTMPPTRVIEVVQVVNEHLPEALKIDLRETRDPIQVQHELEKLIGTVKKTSQVQVPGAPLKRANGRGRKDSCKIFDRNTFRGQELSTISPPASPLDAISAIRRRGRTWEADIPMVRRPTKLEILQEDDENGDTDKMDAEEEDLKDATSEEDEDFFRVTKRRRTSYSPKDVQMITPVARHFEVPLAFKKLYEDVNTSPSPRRNLRARVQPKVPLDGASAPLATANDTLTKPIVIDRSFVNTRARYRSSNKTTRIQKTGQLGQGQGPLQTSTPKANRRKHRGGSFEIGEANGYKEALTNALSPCGQTTI